MTLSYDYPAIAKMIDHSLLNPTLTTQELEDGCALALRYNVASVCILPYALARCAQLLAGSNVNASTTIGFPHGGHTTAIKLAEARQALADGGQELDVVINISKARSGDWPYVQARARRLSPTHPRRPDKRSKSSSRMPISTTRQDPPLRNLRGNRRRLGQDLHRLCPQRRNPCRSRTHAPPLPAQCPGQGRRRHPRS